MLFFSLGYVVMEYQHVWTHTGKNEEWDTHTQHIDDSHPQGSQSMLFLQYTHTHTHTCTYTLSHGSTSRAVKQIHTNVWYSTRTHKTHIFGSLIHLMHGDSFHTRKATGIIEPPGKDSLHLPGWIFFSGAAIRMFMVRLVHVRLQTFPSSLVHAHNLWPHR